MIANYHNHTNRCGHGQLEATDEEYVLAAIEGGFQIMGFSDHNPMPSQYPRQEKVRMDMAQLPEYTASVRHLQEKYKDKIRIYHALECEYTADILPWLRKIRPQYDYLILGTHWYLEDGKFLFYYGHATLPEHVARYTATTLEAMDTGLYIYLAHPDLVCNDYPTFDNACIDSAYAICRKAKELDMPLEYNQYGLRKQMLGSPTGLGYPNRFFWEIAAEVGNTAIIGLDAHRPSQYLNKELIGRAEEDLARLGIPVLETLPGLD